jgi:hypothetical protein
MCSNKRCVLKIFKEWRTQNFEILKFLQQKFSKTQISNLGMAITLDNCKLESCIWCVLEFSIRPHTQNSQKLLKIVRNGYNFGYIKARELHLVSFCAYWSSPYDLILNFVISDNFFQICHFP